MRRRTANSNSGVHPTDSMCVASRGCDYCVSCGTPAGLDQHSRKQEPAAAAVSFIPTKQKRIRLIYEAHEPLKSLPAWCMSCAEGVSMPKVPWSCVAGGVASGSPMMTHEACALSTSHDLSYLLFPKD